MSDYAHRIMQDIKAEDILIKADEESHKQQILAELLAEHAHHQEQAMREGMPEGIDPVYEQFIDNHPEAIHSSRWSQDDGDLMHYRSEDVI